VAFPAYCRLAFPARAWAYRWGFHLAGRLVNFSPSLRFHLHSTFLLDLLFRWNSFQLVQQSYLRFQGTFHAFFGFAGDSPKFMCYPCQHEKRRWIPTGECILNDGHDNIDIIPLERENRFRAKSFFFIVVRVSCFLFRRLSATGGCMSISCNCKLARKNRFQSGVKIARNFFSRESLMPSSFPC
jgi:hypothetical protein